MIIRKIQTTLSLCLIFLINRRGGLELERSPRMREIGVRSPVGTTCLLKQVSDSSTAKRSTTVVSVTGPWRLPLPLSQ